MAYSKVTLYHSHWPMVLRQYCTSGTHQDFLPSQILSSLCRLTLCLSIKAMPVLFSSSAVHWA